MIDNARLISPDFYTGAEQSGVPCQFVFTMPNDLWLKAQLELWLELMTEAELYEVNELDADVDYATAAYSQALLTLEVSPLLGSIIPSMSDPAKLPGNLLPCDGSTYSLADYPLLAQVIDNAWVQTGGTTFKVPDLRAAQPIGTGTASDGTSYTAAETVGARSVTLTDSNLPAHTHTTTIPVPAVINGGLEAPASSAVPSASVTGSTGSNTPFSIVPSAQALLFVLVAG